MSQETVTRKIQTAILRFAAGSFITIGMAIGLVSSWPLYKEIKKHDELQLMRAVADKKVAIQEFLNGSKDSALQVTSRTVIRERLEAYYAGQVRLEELTQFTETKLSDAMSRSSVIAGISRLDRSGNLVARVGVPIPQHLWVIPRDGLREAQIGQPFADGGKNFLVVGAPVLNRSFKRVATDIIVIDLSRLRSIVEIPSGLGKSEEVLLAMRNPKTTSLIFGSSSLRKSQFLAPIDDALVNKALDKALLQESGMLDHVNSESQPYIVAYAPIAGTTWGLAMRVSKDALYRPMWNQLFLTGAFIMLSVLLGTLGMIVVIRPLTGKLIFRAEDLEKEIQAKTAQLHEELAQRKHAEGALRESEERYRLFFDTSRDCVFMTRLDGRFIDFNDVALEVFGYAAKDRQRLLQANVTNFYANPEEREAVVTLLSEQGFVTEYPIDLRKEDGTIIHALVTTVARRSPDGTMIGFQGTVRDITDRKRMEDSLRRNEERFRSLIDQAADAIFVHDFDGRFLEINRRACTSLGYTRDELLSMSVADVDPDAVPRGDSAKFWPNLPATFETRHKRQDGTIFPVEIRLGAIEYGDTKVLLASARDLTDRKRAEESLKEAGAFLETLLNAIPVPVFYKDIDGRYIGFNKSFEEFYGTAQQDLVGKSVFDIAPRELAEVYHAKDLELFDNPGIQVCDSQIKDARGAVHDVVFHKSTFSDPQGRVLGLIGAILDITEHKRAEGEREALRTQLFQAQKMEAVGTLTGGIAHDFNNLLTVINGYTELILSEKTEDDPSYPDLERILETGRKGAELVQRLLALSKKGESNPIPLDLNRAVENISKLIESTFPKIIEIEIMLENDLGIVNADGAQVEQALMNLCINAKEALQEGGRLRIETQNTFVDQDSCTLPPGARPGRHVLLEITDTGIGMSKPTMERMFDPFYTTKGWDFKKGTGLGLSVAKGIVEQQGGWIACESELGRGTTFRLYFPVIEDPPLAGKLEPSTGDVPGGGTILLVDDEELVRDVGKRILERAGYSVCTAANGEEALEIYAREQRNLGLVVLDLIMPQMGGEKCLEELLRINSKLKVVVSSGHLLAQPELDRLSVYAKGFANKPYHAKEFLEVVKRVLGT